MKNLIQNPTLIANKMEVPHIRFDGNSPTLDDVMVDGKPEEWKEPKKAKIIFRDKKRLLGKRYINKLKLTKSSSIYKSIINFIISKFCNE